MTSLQCDCELGVRGSSRRSDQERRKQYGQEQTHKATVKVTKQGLCARGTDSCACHGPWHEREMLQTAACFSSRVVRLSSSACLHCSLY